MTTTKTYQYIKSHFPDFFINKYFRILGYTQQDRIHAEEQFKRDIQKAVSDEEGTELKCWAEKHAEHDYAILRSHNAEEYWQASRVQGEVTQNVADQQLKMYHIFADTFLEEARVSKDRKKKSPRTTALEDSAWVKDNDGIMLKHGSQAGCSVGTVIKAHAVKHRLSFHEVNSATRASISLGLSSILDITSGQKGSQRTLFEEGDWQNIMSKLSKQLQPLSFTKLCKKDIFENIVNTAMISPSGARTSAQRAAAKSSSMQYKALTMTAHLLNLYDKHKYIFNDSSDLSENDYTVKVWGPMLETLFEGTDVVLKWGETISQQTKNSDSTSQVGMKMDTRCLGYSVRSKQNDIDLACVEISHFPTIGKTRHDRVKILVAGKTHLDHILSESLAPNDVGEVYVLEMQIASLECAFFRVSLATCGLYVAEHIGSFGLPVNHNQLHDFQNGIKLLFQFRDSVITNLGRLHSSERQRKNKTSLNQDSSAEKSPIRSTRKDWLRGTWIPPQPGQLPSQPPKNLVTAQNM